MLTRLPHDGAAKIQDAIARGDFKMAQDLRGSQGRRVAAGLKGRRLSRQMQQFPEKFLPSTVWNATSFVGTGGGAPSRAVAAFFSWRVVRMFELTRRLISYSK